MKSLSIHIVIGCLLLLIGSSVHAQEESTTLLIQMESEQAWNQFIQKAQPQKAGINWKTVGDRFHIYQLTVPMSQRERWMDRLRKDSNVRHVENNVEITLRNQPPNDELYSEQWALPLMGAPEAWKELKGSETALNDEIVVAVLDNGFLEDHPDLENQLWVNLYEIPGNAIDDDGNGFIDDIHGWNFRMDIPLHEEGWHGSPVAGILGASTNNGEGIAGMAYNTKLMPLTPSLRTNEIYAALEYAFEQRKLYNESNGQAGSFVVAANLSFGVDFTFPEQLPIWCNLIDSLGKVGIITVASTTNAAIDIEQEGDMPALCGNDAQITVTKTDRNDEKDSFEGGSSSKFVHLGAPGQGIQSTTSDGNYGEFSGTSASAPFVTGAIALLYSSPCTELATLALEAPRETALKVKDLLLNTVKPLPSLETLTISGGRLDVFEAAKWAPIYLCGKDSTSFIQTSPSVDIMQVYPNPSGGTLNISFSPVTFDPVNIQLFDMVGRLLWEEQFDVVIFDQENLVVQIPNKLQRGAYILKLEQNGTEDATIVIYTP